MLEKKVVKKIIEFIIFYVIFFVTTGNYIVSLLAIPTVIVTEWLAKRAFRSKGVGRILLLFLKFILAVGPWGYFVVKKAGTLVKEDGSIDNIKFISIIVLCGLFYSVAAEVALYFFPKKKINI